MCTCTYRASTEQLKILFSDLFRVLLHKPPCLVLNGASIVADLECRLGHARLGEVGRRGFVVVVIYLLSEERVTPSWHLYTHGVREGGREGGKGRGRERE